MVERRSGQERRSIPRDEDERRKRGRPRQVVPTTRINICLSVPVFDAYAVEAHHRGDHLATLLRRVLTKYAPTSKG